jgi:diadenosine tetraphosphate (Ap4A) HIT family hydrolase
MSLYYLGNSRSNEQTAEMIALEAAGICIFCPEHLTRDGTKPILYQQGGWTVTTNDYPYPGAVHHLLLVPSEHVDDLCDLSEALQSGYWKALTWARDTFDLTHYGLGTRNGDLRYTGGTIFHVHVHLVVGTTNAANYSVPIRLKLSSMP